MTSLISDIFVQIVHRNLVIPHAIGPKSRTDTPKNDLQDFEALKDPAKGQTFPLDFSPHHEAIARSVATATASVAMAVNGQAIATRLGPCVFFP